MITEYVEFLADFIEKVSDGPVVLVGHSISFFPGIAVIE
jgi:pimeloyl-ACP methyl ester carboxylesterase